ncbi:MAG: amidohydrolase family protein [Alphaproteobacteria bacterium]
MTTLVRGKWVITGGAQDDPVLSDGAVVIEGGTIAEVGPWHTVNANYPDAEVLGSPDAVVLPGLINAHHHGSGLATVQEGVWDDLLEPWILDHARQRPRDGRLDVLLSAARQLRSGVTTVVDVHSGGDSAKGYDNTVRAKLAAYDQTGMRVAFTPGYRTQSYIVAGAGEDARFIDSLPDDAKAYAESLMPGPDVMSEDDYMAIMDEAHEAYADNPRVDVWFGPPGPQWVSDGFMQRMAERAEALDTGIQTHVNESYYEKLHGLKFYGKPTVCHLRDLGVLSPRFSIAHGVWLTDAEITDLVETGAGVSHNPSSNMRLRAGIAPLNALLEAGVTTAMGMDGTTINDDEDMFAEMRLAMRLSRTPKLGMPAPDPARVFQAATAGGARLLRKETSLGQLKAGFAADVVIANSRPLTFPWVAPDVDARELALMKLSARDVETVLVAGEVVVSDGQPTRIDVEGAGRELAERLAAAPDRTEAARMIDVLKPHLNAWYMAWEVPEATPYITYNSRD